MKPSFLERPRPLTGHAAWVLQLKRGCPVILVWNLNKELKNGGQGVFKELNDEGKLKVMFPNVGYFV